jgi:hypothetical protein
MRPLYLVPGMKSISQIYLYPPLRWLNLNPTSDLRKERIEVLDLLLNS